MAKTQSRPVIDTGDTGLTSEDLELLDQEADLARSQQEADVVRRRKKQEAVRAVLDAGGKSPLSMRNQSQPSRTVTRPEPSEFAKEQEPEEQEQRAARRANPRSEALRRRFEAGTELEVAEAELEAAKATYDKPTVDAATEKRDTAREHVEHFGTTIEGVGGRFSPATPPEGVARIDGQLVNVDTGKVWRAKPQGTLAEMDREIAQMEAELPGRAAWLREQGSPAVGSVKAQPTTPTIRAGLAKPQQQIADLKDRIEQKRAVRSAYKVQQQDLLNNIQRIKQAREAVEVETESEQKPPVAPAPAPAPVAAPTSAPPVFLQPEDYNLEDFGYSLE